MMILLVLILIGIEILRFLEARRFWKLVSQPKEQPEKTPPKARGSFVVKRMEEKLKEAMYPNKL